MNKSVQNLAKSGQNTNSPAQHLRHLRELFNRLDQSVQLCETELIEAYLTCLIADAEVLADTARNIRASIKKGTEK